MSFAGIANTLLWLIIIVFLLVVLLLLLRHFDILAVGQLVGYKAQIMIYDLRL